MGEGSGVKVWTTRSGQILHATASCPHLERRKVLTFDDQDALPVATLCQHRLCVMVRGRAKPKAQAAA
jgi:hypothetical protein